MPTTDLSHRRARSQHGSLTRLMLTVLAVLAVVTAGAVMVYQGVGPFPEPEGCHAEVGDVSLDLSIEQAENATTIAAIGLRRGLPARAVSIALATAMQESKLRNLTHGDRDSLGVFQQRPSQGWGNEKQVRNLYYATNRFYDALVEVEGYESMRITDAAQAVQRSGFPEAYEDHAADARALASALTGYHGGHFSCVVHRGSEDLRAQRIGRDGLTRRAAKVRRALERAFGDLPLGGFAPGGVSTGHMQDSPHYEGRAIDVFVRPVNRQNNRIGWAIAQYLVAHAERLEIEHVIFDDRIWTSGARSEQGWREYDAPSRPGGKATLEHRDHVHVDVPAGS